MRVYHVNSHKKGWAVRKHGSVRASKIFLLKKEALSYAKTIAERIYLHKRDGSIEETFQAVRPVPKAGRP